MKTKNVHRSLALMMLALGAGMSLSAAAMGQTGATAAHQATPQLPKADVFAGYSYINPHGTVGGFPYSQIVPGFIYGGDYFFDKRAHRHLGVQVEGGYHRSSPCANCVYTLEVGPVLQKAKYGIDWTAYTLLGGAGVSGPNVPSVGGSSYFANPETLGFAWTLGGAADYPLKSTHDHFAIRMVELDYDYLHVNFGAQKTTTGGIANINAIQISSGVVYRWDSFRKR